MGTPGWVRALDGLDRIEQEWASHPRRQPSRVLGVLVVAMMVAACLAVAARSEVVRIDETDTEDAAPELVVEEPAPVDGDGAVDRGVDGAAGAAPGDPVTLTVVVETVRADGTPFASSQAFDVEALSGRTVTPLPALDTDPASGRSDRSSATVIAGEVSVIVPPPAGWSLRSARCGDTDLRALWDPSNLRWFARTDVLDDITCRLVMAQDGASVTIITRTVDRSGASLATASDLTLRWSDVLGTTGTAVLDTDPFSAPAASTVVSGPPSRWTITQDANTFGPLVSVVCDGRDTPLIAQHPTGQRPRYGVTIDVRGPITCVFTTMEMQGLHSLRVVHRTVDEAGLDVASADVFSITALTNEGSGTSTFSVDSDPTTARSDRFAVSHFASVASLSVAHRSGWVLASVVCDGRSHPLDATGRGAAVPLTGDTVCVLTSRRTTSVPPPPGVTIVLRTVDAAGNEFDATDPLDTFPVFGFDFGGWSEFATLDTNPATAEPNRVTFQPPPFALVSLFVAPPLDAARAWEVVSLQCGTDPAVRELSVSLVLTTQPQLCTVTVRPSGLASLQLTLETIGRDGAPTTTSRSSFVSVRSGGFSGSVALDTDPSTATAASGSVALPVGRADVTVTAPTGWRVESLSCDTATPVPVPSPTGARFEVELSPSMACRAVVREVAIELAVELVTLAADGSPEESDQLVTLDVVSDRSNRFLMDTTFRTSGRLDRAVVTSATGVHDFVVTLPAGFFLESVTCNGAVSTGNATTVTVDLETDARCVVTLRRLAPIPVTVTVETLDAAGAATASNEFVTVTLAAGITAAGRFDSDPVTTIPSTAVLDVPAGAYRLTVVPPIGWDLVGVDCTPAAEPAADGHRLVVGAPTSCTVRVQARAGATLQIITATRGPGDAAPISSGDAFGYDRTGDATPEHVLDTDPVTARPDRADVPLTPGTTTTVRAVVPAGWRLADVSCTGGAVIVTQDASGAPTGVRVTPDAGAVIDCTFRHRRTTAELAVVLETVDAAGAPVASADAVLVSTTGGLGTFELDTDPATARSSSATAVVTSGLPTTTSLTATVGAGWRLAGVACDQGPAPGGASASVTLDPGARVVCVVTVVRPNPGTASVELRLVTEDASGAVRTSPIDVTLRGSGALGTSVLDTDDLDAIRSATATRTVAAGSYTITADVVAGWSLRDVSCSGSTATDRAPGGTLEGVDLVIAADAQVSCTFVLRAVATATASITIRLEGQLPPDVVGLPANERFGFEGTGPIGSFDLDLDGGSAVPQQRTFVLPAGTYTITELVVPGGVRGWDLIDIACNAGGATDVNGGTAGQPGLLGTTLTVAAGSDVTCSFVNQGRATTFDVFHRTIDANGLRSTDSQRFDYQITLNAATVRTVSLAGSDSTRIRALPGTYRVTVAPVSGWTLQDVECEELATPVFAAGALVGVDVAIGSQATFDFHDCTFVHRRVSTGTARFTLTVDTRTSDGSAPLTPSNIYFVAFLVTPFGEVVHEEEIDTDPNTARSASATAVVEAGDYAWLIGTPLPFAGQFSLEFSSVCSSALGQMISFGRDVTGDDEPDRGRRVTLAGGANESCTATTLAIDAPANVELTPRVLDADGRSFRYDRTITYVFTTGRRSETVTVATTDNLIKRLTGSPGTWRITLTPPPGLEFRELTCVSRASGATVTMTSTSDQFGTGASFTTLPGDTYRCNLDLQVVAPGRITIVKRTFDDTGNEVSVVENFRMGIQPFVGGFSLDTSANDFDTIIFEEYTRSRVMSVPAGTYTFGENPSSNFVLESITCTGPGSSKVTVNRNATRITGATIPVASGDDIVCESRSGVQASTRLTMRVNTLTSGGRLYQDPTRFTFTAPGGTFELASQAGGGVQSTRTVDITAGTTIRVTQSVPDGWELTDITCSLGLVTEVREAGRLVGMDIVVPPNEFPVCSFSNTGDLARVTVVAATERGGSSVTSEQTFRIGGGGVGPFTLDTSPTTSTPVEASAAVTAGRLTLLADAVTGWTLERATCVEASARPSFTTSSTTGGVAVDVQAGDQITCTFVHREDSTPPVNRVPVCQPLVLSVVAGSSGSVAPSCVDPDGDPLTFAVGGSPAKGSASVVSGSLRFVANAGASGAESFTYTASDGRGGTSEPATVSVTITTAPPVNRVPVCQPLVLSVVAGSSGSVAPSCVDPDGDPLTFAVGGSPAKGSASVVSGSLRFVANAGASGAESFTYTASDGRGGTSQPATVSVTITTAPPVLPVATVVGGSVVEGTGAGSTVLRFTVQLSAPAPAGGSSVRYVASAGSASADDFTAVSGTATVAAGARSATVDVPVTRDAVDESDETVVVTISSQTGATLGSPASAGGTIVDDDEPVTPPSVEVSLDTWWECIDEGDGGYGSSFEFVITLSEPAPAEGVTVRYRTADGLAKAGEDYIALDDRLVIPAGQQRAFVRVRFIGDDLVEEHEDFFLELVSTSANAVIGVDRRSRGIIANDDW